MLDDKKPLSIALALPAHLSVFGDSLPYDAVALAYEAHEGVSVPYSVEVTFVTGDPSFRVDACLGQRVSLVVSDAQGSGRHYDGVPDRAGFVAASGSELMFRLRLRPAIAALEHREGSRIFQTLSPVDVIKTLLSEAGVDERVEWRLRKSYAPREFLCQYRETEMSFVSRLLEDEGIFYFFLHTGEGHTLVFADDSAAFLPQDDVAPVVLTPAQGGGVGAQPVMELRRSRGLRPTAVRLRDYDFEKPDLPPEAALPSEGKLSLRHYRYPGGFTVGGEGSRRAEAAIRSLRSDADVVRAKSRAVGLVCGVPFSLQGAREAFLQGDFVVTELRSSGRAGGDACENELSAMPQGAPFAAPRRARRPKIRGVQTAVVTGPTKEAQGIHVDRYGRVKVRFFWDRSGKQDDTSSCWLRVSQLAMGGSMVLPRIGWEVAVVFLDGDPDRPLVIGRVYNAENTPPYALPGAAADGSLKSMSTPGGAGMNELKMGDSAGSQGLSLSAQKDLNVSTGNDKNETVAVNDAMSVGSNYAVTVGANESTTVGGNQSLDVGNALTVKVAGAQAVSVGGDEQAHAKCDYVEKVGGSRAYTVGGSYITISCGVRQQITQAFSRGVGAVQASISLASIDDNMLATYDETVGAVSVQLVAGASAETVAADKDLTSSAAELHAVAAMSTEAAAVKQLIGGVHLRKVGGDYVVQAPIIVLAGGVGKFNGGGSSVQLNGGPVVLAGSKIAINAGAVVKLASSLKIG